MDPVPLPSSETPTETTPSPALPNKNKQLVLLSLLLATSMLMVGVVIGFMAGTQCISPSSRYSSTDNLIPQESPYPDAVVCTMDAMLCPDGSSVGRVGPDCNFATCPKSSGSPDQTWERKQYMIEDRIVWDILQPTTTTARTGGLYEGSLLLSSQDSDTLFSSEFSFPKLLRSDNTMIQTFEEYVEDNILTLAQTHHQTQVINLNHPSLQMSLLLSTEPILSPSQPINSSLATILIWKHTSAQGVADNPSQVRIAPHDASVDLQVLQSFATKLALGIMP